MTPQVAVGVALGGVAGLTLDDCDLGGHREQVPAELGLAGLVLAVQPLAYDLISTPPGGLYGSVW
jgi:hypothetical protein